MADNNDKRSGEPSLSDMAKYTIVLQDAFEQINDALTQHEAGYINEKTTLSMIDETVKKVVLKRS